MGRLISFFVWKVLVGLDEVLEAQMTSFDIAENYARDGFVFPLDVLTHVEAAALRSDLEAAEAELAGDPERLSLMRAYTDQSRAEFEKMIGLRQQEWKEASEGMKLQLEAQANQVDEYKAQLESATQLEEKLMDVESLFQRWRFDHATAVERVIGMQPGTGGSSGVAFLKKALELKFFHDLYDLRSELIYARKDTN